MSAANSALEFQLIQKQGMRSQPEPDYQFDQTANW